MNMHLIRGGASSPTLELPPASHEGIRACWRCGVDWDCTDYMREAPCLDCQPYVEGEHRKFYRVAYDEKARRIAAVKHLLGFAMTSEAIGVEIGLDPRTVRRIIEDINNGVTRRKHGSI